jgi:hypothetical protein
MIAGILLLLPPLFAASSGRLVVMDETVRVPARRWEAFSLEVKQQPVAIECRYEVAGRGPGVRLSLMHRADMERFRDGIRHRVLAATDFEKSGGLRYGAAGPGEYSVVVDNRLAGSRAADVRLTVSLIFAGARAEAQELSPRRRLVVILMTLAYMGAAAVIAVRRLRGVLFGRN